MSGIENGGICMHLNCVLINQINNYVQGIALQARSDVHAKIGFRMNGDYRTQ